MKDTDLTSAWRFSSLHDEDQFAGRAYFAACTPDYYVFDSNMKLTYCGQFDNSLPAKCFPATGEDLARAVQSVIENGSPLPRQRSSAGCSIKWKPGNEPPCSLSN
jgi:hypothetical protein